MAILHQSAPLGAALALAGATLVGCERDDRGGPAQAREVELVAVEHRFTPDHLLVEPAEALAITLANDGAAPHGITFALPGGHESLVSALPPGQTEALRMIAPATPGDYDYYCPLDGHRELGMVGTLSVRERPEVELVQVLDGLTAPVAIGLPGDASGRWFVVDQIGVIRTIRGDAALDQPFLDLRDRMVALNESYDERGLLGLAFHPGFAKNGRFFVYYSAPLRPEAPDNYDHTSHLSEFTISADDPDRADLSSERLILAVDQPQDNHNGGTLAFGPDGLLYVSLGDGGDAGDTGLGHPPAGNGQAIDTLLGSLLRLDVDGPAPYGIPEDNPFVGADGADEIFAYGFRNPYRFSFDRGGQRDLLVGDAGQELWEEISLVRRGENHGWNIREGTHCFDPARPMDPPKVCSDIGPRGEPLIPPVVEFKNAKADGPGLVVIGGHVYRGAAVPALAGSYVFGAWTSVHDRPSGALFYALPRPQGAGLWPMQPIRVTSTPGGDIGHYLLGFAEDRDGELFVLTTDEHGPSGTTGKVFRVRPPRQ